MASATFATNMISLASFLFMVVSVILAWFGISEWRGFRQIKEKVKKDSGLFAHIQLAEMYDRNGMTDKAISEYESAKLIQPDNIVAATRLGFLYDGVSYEKAVDNSKKAVELDARNFAAYLNLGVSLSNAPTDRTKEALDAYLKAEEISKISRVDIISMGKVKLFIGHCYKKLGENANALLKYKEAEGEFNDGKKINVLEVNRQADHWLDELNRKRGEIEGTSEPSSS